MESHVLSSVSLAARSVALLCGVAVLLLAPVFPPLVVVFAVLAATAAAFAVPHGVKAFTLGAWFGVGFLLAAVHAHEYLQLRWAGEGTRVLADAVVETIPEAYGGIWQFDASVRIRAPQPSDVQRRVRLVSRHPEIRPRAGERWELLVELRTPRARLNPGAFDMERVLFQERVHALGVIVPSRLNRRISDGHRPLTAVRERIARHIDAVVADRDAAALIAALAVGATGAMSREQWRVFNATGTTHLVAISGLHVTLFALVSIVVARRLWTTLLWKVVKTPRESFAALIGLCSASAYAALAGFSVPTQRTLLMFAMWLLVRSIARATPPATSLAAALAAVLFLDPFSVLAPGFWLSFGTMAAIIYVTEPRVRRRGWLSEALAVQVAASLALTPVTLACFGSVSLIGPLVNLVAIPVVSWIFVPLVLMATLLLPVSPPAADQLFRLAAFLHEKGWPALWWVSDLNWALIHANPRWWWYPAAAMAVVILLMPWPARVRAAVLLTAVTLVTSGDRRAPAEGHLLVTVLDVGQATAIVLQTRRHVLLFGTGASFGSEGGNVEAIVLPFLRSRGIRKIDILLAEESADSSGAGVTAVVAALPVQRLVPRGGCPEREVWFRDAVRFELMRARAGLACVLLAEAGGQRLLIAGEADEAEQHRLAVEHDVAANVVVLPRNGTGGTADSFVREVSAQWVIVSGTLHTAAGNTRRSVRRWQETGAQVLVTADSGAVEIRAGPGIGLAPREERRARPALWHP